MIEGQINLLSSFWKDDSDLHLLVRDSLGRLRALYEREVEDVCVTLLLLKEGLSIGVPTNSERVFPTTKDWVSGLDLKQRLSLVASEAGSRYIADDVGEVGILASDSKWKLQFLESERLRVEVLALSILDPIEQS